MDVTLSRVLETLEKLLHKKVVSSKIALPQLTARLNSKYTLTSISIGDVSFILVFPEKNVNLKSIRFDYRTISKLSDNSCAMYIHELTTRKREILLEDAIPFISENRHIYLPFLGLVFWSKTESERKHIVEFSFLTQKLLLMAIYGRWTSKSMSEIAKTLSVSKMTAKRCFDEIESLVPELIVKEKRERIFVFEGSKRELYNLVKPHLRTPVKREFSIEARVTGYTLSGESALATYTMLGAPRVPVYAITPSQASKISANYKIREFDDSLAKARFQVMGYALENANHNSIDPISAILSLRDDDYDDPRIEDAIEMIERRCIYDWN
ncbi:MAG: hypothetical protein LBL41_03025 [Bifidobacteriaceae bacterium]|jgi:hypothetical protein|nr:hypothetical protein [Bifidobacteriaceae bacterium]